MPELVSPDVRFAESFRAAMADFAAEGRGGPDDDSALAHGIRDHGGTWQDADGFAAFVEELHRAADPAVAPPPNWVHCSTFWWVEDDRFLGSLRIRHQLNAHLLELGGHIGYDVAPAARLRGHGTAMLGAALPRAAELGLDPVLVTCDNDNLGSRKIIEANGGVFEDERSAKLRFWVPTSRPA